MTKKITSDDKTVTFDVPLKKLIAQGKKRGYVTQAEVFELFPQAEDNLETLDSLYEKLMDSGVDVFDVDSVEEAEDLKLTEELDVSKISMDKAVLSDPVRMYLREIGKVSLLNAAQEIDYAKKAEVIKLNALIARLTKQLKAAPSDNVVAKEMEIDKQALKEVRAFAKTVTKRECELAAERLTQANLRLVVSIAKRHMGRGLFFLDLIQEGNIGLMRAVEKFDWRRGFKFSTYATWWIRQAITRAIADQARTIRIPVHMIETMNKYKRVQRKLEQELERTPTAEEIAKEMGIEVTKANEIEKISQETTSLETTVGKEEDSRLKEFIPDESTLSPFDSASHELLKEHIVNVLDSLNPRERRVLELRFGLRDGKSRTLEEVGKEFGVTRERIRQIEAKALRKLRHPSRSKRLRDYL